MSHDSQQAILQLFGATTGMQADNFRLVAQTLEVVDQQTHERRSSSHQEVEDFVKFSSIFKMNAFGDSNGNQMVYNILTRMSHSCAPNCVTKFVGVYKVLRVIVPVKQGEELTISYNEEHNNKPTHFRRHRYLNFKDFTCHCPRCMAPGDDTRQFSCFDAKCTGQHFACQPINRELLMFPEEQKYTPDVTFI